MGKSGGEDEQLFIAAICFKSLHLSCCSRSEQFFYIGNISAALKEPD